MFRRRGKKLRFAGRQGNSIGGIFLLLHGFVSRREFVLEGDCPSLEFERNAVI
jgi:hypothetical protein